MPDNINLLTLSDENIQSKFPALYNSNTQTIKNSLNEVIDIINEDISFVAGVSGALHTELVATSGVLNSKIVDITNQIGTISLLYTPVATTDVLDSRVLTLEQGISGIETQLISISGISILQSEINDNLTTIYSLSASLNSKIDSLDSEYATDTMVASISGYLLNEIQSNTSVINSNLAQIPSMSASLLSTISDVENINSSLDTKLDTSVYASVSGSKDPTGATITENTIISSFDKVHAVNISGGSVISISGSPVEGNYIRFYDTSNNINTNSLTISGSGLEYVFNDNRGMVTFEYRNSEWVTMASNQTKFLYDDANNIVTNPIDRGIISNRFASGVYGPVTISNMDNTYNLEANVVDNGLFFINANSPNPDPFNIGNYNNTNLLPYEITAISHQGSNFPWNAFDGSVTPISGGWVSSNISSGWIDIDLGNTPKKFTNMRFHNGNTNDDRPVDFIIDASDDYLTWDVLANVTGDTTPVGTWSNIVNLATQKTYKHYRFNVLNNNGGDQIRILEIDFREGTESSSNNNFDFTMYDGPSKSFSPSTFQLLDDVGGSIYGYNKVNISYDVNTSGYSQVYDLEDFRGLPSLGGVNRLDLKIQLIGNLKYSESRIGISSTFVEQTDDHIRLVNDGTTVFNVDQTGTLKTKNIYTETITISGGNVITNDSKYTEDVGDGLTNPITITHNLNTRSMVYSIMDNDTFEVLDSSFGNPKIIYPTLNTAEITFGDIPSIDKYKVTFIG